ncbi:MAG: hypothetical protein P8L18_03820 [Verrucomicrobiota bacterium]|jgi:hypothetical protein|nr:hypothetical protein [Verrucomicrobiota bacterium]
MHSGNIDFTTALSLLLSRSDFRRRLKETPGALLDEWNMNAEDRTSLLSIDLDHLEQQANGLISKRFHEVRPLLPMTLKELPMHGRKYFFKFADSFWPEGHHRHVLDALAFARFLERQKGDTCSNHFEKAWLTFLIGNRRWITHALADFPWKNRLYYAWVIMYRNHKNIPRYGAFTMPRWNKKTAHNHKTHH